jgi:hypothetical protein
MPRFLTEASFFDPLLPSSSDEIGGPDLINEKPSQASAVDPESDVIIHDEETKKEAQT